MKVDNYFEDSVLEARLGTTKDINIFNKEGSPGIHVKVPSTDNPEKVIWVIACTEEVQCCGQIAAINAVVLTKKSKAMRHHKALGNL